MPWTFYNPDGEAIIHDAADVTVTPTASDDPVSYTLVEFYLHTQYDEDGHAYWERHSSRADGTGNGPSNGVYYILGSAVDAAAELLASDRDGFAPLVGLIGHDYDVNAPEPDDPQGWSQGWIDAAGFHWGDYENDPPYWNPNPITSAKEA